MKSGVQYIDSDESLQAGIKRIILAGDPGCTGFNGESKTVFDQILKQKVDAFIILGDLAFIGTAEEFQEIIEFCNCRVQVPVFAVCGNHDVSHYKQFLGLPDYSIVSNDFLFIFLNNSSGHFTGHNIEFLRKTLNKYVDKNIVLAMHIPPPTKIERSHMSYAEWNKLKAVLDPHRKNVRQIFSAHIHGFHQYELDGYAITITAGAGSAMTHDVKLPGQKIHHAVALNLHDNGQISMEVIKISTTPL